MKNIKINEATKRDLVELARVISEAQARMGIICQTYLNAKGAKGKYTLSSDFKELTPVVEDKL